MKLCILAAFAVLFVVVVIAEPAQFVARPSHLTLAIDPPHPRYIREAEAKTESEEAKSDAGKSTQKPTTERIDVPPPTPPVRPRSGPTFVTQKS